MKDKIDNTEKNELKTEKKKEPMKKPVSTPKIDDKPGFKGIVRLAGKDIRGHVKLKRALSYVRGIGSTLNVSVANLLHSKFGFPIDKEVGELTDQDIEKIDKLLFSLQDYEIPKFLLNRRGDFLDGVDKHVIMNDLIFNSKQDIEREKKLYTWKGYRFNYGQKVRGQRTRNTGRTGMSVGVLRKSIIAAAQAQKEAPAKGGATAPPAGGKAPASTAPAGGAAKAAPTTKPAGAAKSAEKSEKK